MTRKIIDYQVITGISGDKFNKEILKLINQGYELQGGASIIRYPTRDRPEFYQDYLTQALIKYQETTPTKNTDEIININTQAQTQ